MKKTDFVKSIAETLMEWYPTGGYRITMDDLKKNVPPKPMTEYDDNPQGSPENQENPEYYDQQYDKPAPQSESIRKFEHIDWKAVYDTMVHNQGVIDKKIDNIAFNRGDFIDENLLTYEELEVLAASGLMDLGEGAYPVLSEPMDFEAFKTAVKKAFDEAMKPQTSGGNDSEAPYLRGNEPMSEQDIPTPERIDKSACCGAPMKWDGLTPYCTKCRMKTKPATTSSNNGIGAANDILGKNLHEIYRQFKAIIKEEINEVDFSKKIRGVVYEYAQEVPGSTPTTQDPKRDPEENPDNVISKGQNMEDIGKAMKDMGEKVKTIKSKTQATSAPAASTGAVALKEYVKKNILPAVVEIINKSQNPRSTKRELMEMFKPLKKR
jgi:hypothetical protein